MAKILLKNAQIVNEGKVFNSDILISDEIIEKIAISIEDSEAEVLDLSGKLIIPGMIDDQVHFREPGLTNKGEIYTESRAAVAGGITSFMEMPNTVPNTLTQELLEAKYQLGAEKSIANYSFFMGASNDNIDEVLKTNPQNVCGVKVFMGSSTGNMLVDNEQTLTNIFSKCNMLIATHCEDEATIRKNLVTYKEKGPQHNPAREEYEGENTGPFDYSKYAQCDCLLAKKEFVHTVLDCEVKMEGAKDSDHYPIVGKIMTNMNHQLTQNMKSATNSHVLTVNQS